jgi:microcystin degradation protein MlrC
MKNILFLGLLLLVGCATSSTYTMLSSKEYSKNDNWQKMPVYAAKEDIPGSFEKIALVFTDFQENAFTGNQSDTELMLIMLRKKAGQLGANALLVDQAAINSKHASGTAIFVTTQK